MKCQVTCLLLLFTAVLLQAAPLQDSDRAEDARTKAKREISQGKDENSPLIRGSSEEFGEILPLVRPKRSALEAEIRGSSEEFGEILPLVKSKRSALEAEIRGSSEEFGEILPLVKSKRSTLDIKGPQKQVEDSSDGVTKVKIVRRRSEEDSNESDDVSDDRKRRRSQEDDDSDESDDDDSDRRKRREDTASASTTTTTTTALPLIVVAPTNVPVKKISTAIKEDLSILEKKIDTFESKVEEGVPTVPSVGVLAGQDTPQDKETVIHTISSAKYIVH